MDYSLLVGVYNLEKPIPIDHEVDPARRFFFLHNDYKYYNNDNKYY